MVVKIDEKILEDYIEKFFKVDPDDGVGRRGMGKHGKPNFTTWREIVTALYYSDSVNEAAVKLHYGTTRRASNNDDAAEKGMEGSLAKKKKTLGMSWTQALGKDNPKNWRSHIQQSLGYNTCTICEEIMELKNFKCLNDYTYTGAKYKSDVYRNECHECYKVKQNARVKKYKSENPHIINDLSARRRALKQASWEKLSTEEQEKVRSIYKESSRLNEEAGFIKYHVDHIKPLSKGGVHHPDNLQILLAEENLKKSDKWDENI